MLDRFVIAVESIAASLAVIASSLSTPFEVAETAPQPAPRGRGRPAKAPATTSASPEPAPAAAAAATPTAKTLDTGKVVEAKPAAQPPANPEPDFDYEVLKAVVVELVNIGAEGKSAAVNVLTKYGVRKASEAAPAEWPKIHADLVKELEILQSGNSEIA